MLYKNLNVNVLVSMIKCYALCHYALRISKYDNDFGIVPRKWCDLILVIKIFCFAWCVIIFGLKMLDVYMDDMV